MQRERDETTARVIGAGWGYPHRPQRKFNSFTEAHADQLAKAVVAYLQHGSMNNYWRMDEALKRFQQSRENNLGRVDL